MSPPFSRAGQGILDQQPARTGVCCVTISCPVTYDQTSGPSSSVDCSGRRAHSPTAHRSFNTRSVCVSALASGPRAHASKPSPFFSSQLAPHLSISALIRVRFKAATALLSVYPHSQGRCDPLSYGPKQIRTEAFLDIPLPHPDCQVVACVGNERCLNMHDDARAHCVTPLTWRRGTAALVISE
ncbi:hypothetical protein CC85DRAFT_118986 [Cutaneotrichosporon oleaginosum]|uniref:Uncharacterized protein n=1 Tax=Cutaneotrichosporon oleaginosum TaxID=879819 RepID=A0A0J1B1U6_9TREE|nr:uncharacterized protein CC85DRAFT_118986 [Cutaneotrichosporon oleaginosum]KLT41589.1 hypothetical protein CC85DRAFT_118986 [Cutaneotrichosporon oleaginosum]TXT09355.1 hypothetical protein COLE_03289 [Cutaneotrichosporon oleaginosum]